MLRARFLHLKYNLLGPGIKPRSAACQAGVPSIGSHRGGSKSGILSVAMDWARVESILFRESSLYYPFGVL